MVRLLASRPSCPRVDFGVPQNFTEENIVNVAEVNQQRCIEESGQRLENVGQTHLVLASGMLVQQK